MNNTSKRIPVIIGIGELLDRQADVKLEPIEMLIQCARAADKDAGGGWVRQIDCVRVVNSMTWPYRHLPKLLGRRLRLRNAEAIHGPVGGETPISQLLEAATDIADGLREVVLLCGAESTKTLMNLISRGQVPAWTDRAPNAKPLQAEDFVTPLCARYGLALPMEAYPLYENATRSAWGLSFEQAQAESGLIGEGMAKIAMRNPYAWSGKALTAEDIVTPSDSNRYVAFPYTKFQVAQIGVNQASAVLLTHRDAALAAGIPEERLVYVWSGAGAQEPEDILSRADYTSAPALDRALKGTLEANGLQARDLDLFELYSCFPVVPKLARRTLGLAADAQLTVAGGLTFFGGPTNNYMGHAITAMTRALRSEEGSKGLLYGNGAFITKHHAVVLATTPPTHTLQNLDLQSQCEAAQGSVPELVEYYTGPATIETFTFSYTAKGKPDRGTVILRTPQGQRTLARVTGSCEQTVAWLLDPSNPVIGSSGEVYDGNDGLNHFALSLPDNIPEPALKFEKIGEHIALVTLNRPEKRNTINGAVTRLMVQYLKQIEEDPKIRVAILCAAGDKAFCAGADLAEASLHGQDLTAGGNGFAGFVNAKRRKPWIAAVRGFAVGGGTELTLACDLAVAGHSATFGLPEVSRGLIAAAGGLYRAPRALPPRIASELILTGMTMNAHRALELHLVNRVVDDEQLLEETIRLAKRIAANAPLAVCASREVANAAFDMTDDELATFSMEKFMPVFISEDFQEGPRAFFEKRPPVWKGR